MWYSLIITLSGLFILIFQVLVMGEPSPEIIMLATAMIGVSYVTAPATSGSETDHEREQMRQENVRLPYVPVREVREAIPVAIPPVAPKITRDTDLREIYRYDCSVERQVRRDMETIREHASA